MSAGISVCRNFSLSDLRCITPEHFGALALPVAEFIALENGTEFLGYSIPSPVDASKAVGSPTSPPPAAALKRGANLSFIRRRNEFMQGRGWVPGQEVGQVLVTAHTGNTLGEARRFPARPGGPARATRGQCSVPSPAQVLENLVKFHVHRIWITDDDNKPVGIVTPIDVIKAVVASL